MGDAKSYQFGYSVTITLWKVFFTYLQTLGVLGAADVLAQGTPATMDEFLAKWPTLLVAVLPAAWRALENWRKNYDPKGPLWTWPWAKALGMPALFLAVSIALSGCATYKTKLVDGTDGSSMQLKLGALFGKVNPGDAQGAYKWDATGGGEWKVGANSEGADATGAIEIVKAIVPLIQAAATGGLGSPSSTPDVAAPGLLERITDMAAQIQQLRALVEGLRAKRAP